MVKKKKADKVWAYKVKHPQATTREIATATGASYNYVHKLMSKISTPKEVLDADLDSVIGTWTTRSWKSRGDILDTAKGYVMEDRASEHGDMESNFQMIGEYWSVHLGTEVSATDVSVMMTLLKVARIKSNASNMDNWVDAAGYMACGGEIASK